MLIVVMETLAAIQQVDQRQRGLGLAHPGPTSGNTPTGASGLFSPAAVARIARSGR